ncbi:MAG: hypothetical protein ABUL77_02500 [Bacteroidota bacterium]
MDHRLVERHIHNRRTERLNPAGETEIARQRGDHVATGTRALLAQPERVVLQNFRRAGANDDVVRFDLVIGCEEIGQDFRFFLRGIAERFVGIRDDRHDRHRRRTVRILVSAQPRGLRGFRGAIRFVLRLRRGDDEVASDSETGHASDGGFEPLTAIKFGK